MTITKDEARELAGFWHGGQSSPLYAFSSSGHVSIEALYEARECLAELDGSDAVDGDNRAELMALGGYLHAAVTR